MVINFQVFFGPTCSYDLAPVVRYTFASWDIPVLSSAGRIMVFDNKVSQLCINNRTLGPIIFDESELKIASYGQNSAFSGSGSIKSFLPYVF